MSLMFPKGPILGFPVWAGGKKREEIGLAVP